MKYIMFEDFGGDPVPVIFPNRIEFEQMREQIPYSTVLSAGYVQLRAGSFATHGRAADIDKDSRPEDAAIIAEKFGAPES